MNTDTILDAIGKLMDDSTATCDAKLAALMLIDEHVRACQADVQKTRSKADKLEGEAQRAAWAASNAKVAAAALAERAKAGVPTTTTSYSLDNEDFRFETPEDAFDALDADGMLVPGAVYYGARFKPLTADRILKAEDVINQADEIGYDLIGETWGNPLAVDDDATAELQALLDGWMAKHVDLSRYQEDFGQSSAVVITQADIDAYRKEAAV